jgi:hypothetical protein
VQTFTATHFRLHLVETASIKMSRSSGKREENPLPKKTEKEEKKMTFVRRGKRTEPEEDNNFKPPQLPRFQPGGLIQYLTRLGGFEGVERGRCLKINARVS